MKFALLHLPVDFPLRKKKNLFSSDGQRSVRIPSVHKAYQFQKKSDQLPNDYRIKIILVTTEFACFSDVFKFVFFNKDGYEFRYDSRGADQCMGEFPHDSSLLFSGQAFSCFQDYDGHSEVSPLL
jgi:hypothetical protein